MDALREQGIVPFDASDEVNTNVLIRRGKLSSFGEPMATPPVACFRLDSSKTDQDATFHVHYRGGGRRSFCHSLGMCERGAGYDLGLMSGGSARALVVQASSLPRLALHQFARSEPPFRCNPVNFCALPEKAKQTPRSDQGILRSMA
jgi:hypothetical protein